MVQEPLAPEVVREPPENEIEVAFVAAVTVPPHCDSDQADATLRPDGRGSVKEIADSAEVPAAVLLMVNVSVDVDPDGIDVGEKAFVNVGSTAGQPV